MVDKVAEVCNRNNVYELAKLLCNMGLISAPKIRAFVCSLNPNRALNYMLFEYVVAIKYIATLWANLGADVKKNMGVSVADSGIDCVSSDLKHVIQAKWYKPKRRISHTSISTFFTSGATMDATRFTIVTSERVTLIKSRPRIIGHDILNNTEFGDILLASLQKQFDLEPPKLYQVIECKTARPDATPPTPLIAPPGDAKKATDEVRPLVDKHITDIKTLFEIALSSGPKNPAFLKSALHWHTLIIQSLVDPTRFSNLPRGTEWPVDNHPYQTTPAIDRGHAPVGI